MWVLVFCDCERFVGAVVDGVCCVGCGSEMCVSCLFVCFLMACMCSSARRIFHFVRVFRFQLGGRVSCVWGFLFCEFRCIRGVGSVCRV